MPNHGLKNVLSGKHWLVLCLRVTCSKWNNGTDVGFFCCLEGFFLVPVMKEKSPLDTDAPISFSVWFPKLSRTCLICFVIVAVFFLTPSYCCVYLTSLTNSLLKMWVGFLVGIKMKSSTVNWKIHQKFIQKAYVGVRTKGS